MPHYGIRLHLEVLDKDFVTGDDFIGTHVLALGQKDDVSLDFSLLVRLNLLLQLKPQASTRQCRLIRSL